MRKSELENGMIVKIRRGEFGLIAKNKILFKSTFVYLVDFTDDLKMAHRDELDIIEIYNQRAIFCLGDLIDIKERDLSLVWKRDKEIDWNKVPKFIPVQVELEGGRLINRYFLKYNDCDSYPFKVTKCDEFTFKSLEDEAGCFGDDETYVKVIESHYYEFWKKCKIHPNIEIKKEWYK